jgi:hypothetical protein
MNTEVRHAAQDIYDALQMLCHAKTQILTERARVDALEMQYRSLVESNRFLQENGLPPKEGEARIQISKGAWDHARESYAEAMVSYHAAYAHYDKVVAEGSQHLTTLPDGMNL